MSYKSLYALAETFHFEKFSGAAENEVFTRFVSMGAFQNPPSKTLRKEPKSHV